MTFNTSYLSKLSQKIFRVFEVIFLIFDSINVLVLSYPERLVYKLKNYEIHFINFDDSFLSLITPFFLNSGPVGRSHFYLFYSEISVIYVSHVTRGFQSTKRVYVIPFYCKDTLIDLQIKERPLSHYLNKD